MKDAQSCYPQTTRNMATGISNTKKTVSIAQNKEEVFTIPIWPQERACWVRKVTKDEMIRIERDIQVYKLHFMEIHPDSRQYLALRGGKWREELLQLRKRKVQEANYKLFVGSGCNPSLVKKTVHKPSSMSSGCLPCNPALVKKTVHKTVDNNGPAQSEEEDWVIISKDAENSTRLEIQEDWILV